MFPDRDKFRIVKSNKHKSRDLTSLTNLKVSYWFLICPFDFKEFEDIKIGKTAISKERFLMCIRPSMKNYLSKLNEICSFEDGILFYGMWKGYLERDDMKEFVDFMNEKGVKLHVLHTSGHADEMTVENLIEDVSPKLIIPVHTENAEWFSGYDNIKVVFDCKNYIV